MTRRYRKRPGEYRPVKEDAPINELIDRLNELIMDGIYLDKDIKGEILSIVLAPNESKIISHGLRAIPQYRIILRQTGNAVITDVNASWTDRTIGLKNNSGTDTVNLTIKLC